VVYDAGFARPDVVYEVLLPDHMRVDVQYEESERASPKDVVPRESDGAMELEFSPVSDEAAAHAAEQAAKAERDARVAAQQAQLELVMKAKRDMEAARQSIFMLEKHRRERSVYRSAAQGDRGARQIARASAGNVVGSVSFTDAVRRNSSVSAIEFADAPRRTGVCSLQLAAAAAARKAATSRCRRRGAEQIAAARDEAGRRRSVSIEHCGDEHCVRASGAFVGAVGRLRRRPSRCRVAAPGPSAIESAAAAGAAEQRRPVLVDSRSAHHSGRRERHDCRGRAVAKGGTAAAGAAKRAATASAATAGNVQKVQ
jgi:hypothetical protein